MRKALWQKGRTWLALAIAGALVVLAGCSPAPVTSPTPTTGAAPTLKITSPTGNVPTPGNVTVTVEVTNFNIVDKQGQPKVAGEGHLHYFMDVDAPTTPNQPAIPAEGSVWAHVATTTYTFTDVAAGAHTISVELVNNDHTPLVPPVVQKIAVTLTGQSPSPSPTTSPTPTSSPTPVSINLIAQSMAFDQNKITVPAGAAVTIVFENKESVPHNFAVYMNSSAAPPPIFRGDTITGPKTITYKFTAPTQPGNYFFQCDVHPAIMTGTFVVQ